MPPNARPLHAPPSLATARSVMRADAFPDHGHPLETPGAFPCTEVDDPMHGGRGGRAAPSRVPVTGWSGDRYGQVRDPFAGRVDSARRSRRADHRLKRRTLDGTRVSGIVILFLTVDGAHHSGAIQPVHRQLKSSAIPIERFVRPFPGYRDWLHQSALRLAPHRAPGRRCC